jgi:hypothetical protein
VNGALRIALVVPDYRYTWEDKRHCRVKDLRAECRNGRVDLVVLPEAYEPQAGRQLQNIVNEWAAYFNAPTIVGVGTDDGFQVALYRNPKPERGDSATHLYVKHSTSERVAFEWPNYRRVRDAMFTPIILSARRIAVQICHDMFFGLVGQRMNREGAEVFLDISGGGVNFRKWSNVIQGRSLELEAAFLCTMAKRSGEGGAARALAFHNGTELEAVVRKVGHDGFGGYEIYEVPAGRRAAGRTGTSYGDEDQPYTDKRYRDITIAPRGGASADIVMNAATSSLTVGARHVQEGEGWHGFESAAGRVGVLAMGIDSLRDGTILYKHVPPRGTFDHHVVGYLSSREPAAVANLLALAKLRAIEHRLGVVIQAGDYRVALKTNRYKNIQRFQEVNGVFGLNAEFLGGTWSTAGTTPTLGIPDRFFSEYLALLG